MNNMTSSVSLETTTKELERDCAFGGLFHQIINEMKNSAPLWEDLTVKSTKLHSCLRATIQAVSAFLDAIQKIADAATSTKGATKDIGTSLTRICMRHKALEAKMKTFTGSILDCLIIPLQERMEDWKRTTSHLDKEHAKEYKRGRGELKKRSMETMRLQKKVRKGNVHNGGMSGSFAGTLPRSGGGISGSGSHVSSNGGDHMGGNRDMNRILEVALRDVTEKRQAFEDSEKDAIRSALIEERSRFCLFVSFLKPVVDEEVAMLYELTHVQEAMLQLEKHASDPFALPPSSEQVITDLKGSCDSGTWSFTTPPSSPSSLGSRKSSTCSISSANSSSSSSAQSPSHNLHNRTILHQPMMSGPGGTLRYSILSSQDSGFTSQDTLFNRIHPRIYDQRQSGGICERSNPSSTGSSNSSTPSSPYPPGTGTTSNATWPNLQDSIQFERAACAIMNERPHTISSGYERGHQRPPLTVYTFQPPSDVSHPISPSGTPVTTPINDQPSHIPGPIYQSTSEIYGILRGKNESKPPVPKRCSSLERPQSHLSSSGEDVPPKHPPKGKKDGKRESVGGGKPMPVVPDFNQSAPDMIVPQPVYVNMHELNQMAAMKLHRQQQTVTERYSYPQLADLPPPPPELMNSVKQMDGVEMSMKNISIPSSGYGSGTQMNVGEENSMTQMDGEGLCVCFDLVASGYCTLPRVVRHFGSCPFANTGHTYFQKFPEVYETGHVTVECMRNTDTDKPLPPVRKTSSISSAAQKHSSIPIEQLTYQNCIYSNMDEVHSSQGSSTSSQGSVGAESGDITPHASMEHLPPPPAYLMNLPVEQRNLFLHPDDPALKRMSVAETIKTLTEKRHQPVSPNMVRRSQSMRQPGEEKETSHQSKHSNTNWNNRRSSATNIKTSKCNSMNEKERNNLMHVLNQQLAQVHQPTYGNLAHPSQQQQYIHAQPQTPQQYTQMQQQVQHQQSIPPNYPSNVHPSQQPIYQQVIRMGTNSQSANNSPRHPRRFSEELLKTTATFVQNRVLGNKTPTPVVTSKEIFVQTLNAKLSAMRVSSPPTDKKHSPSLPATKTSFASKLAASVTHHPKGNSVGEISTAFRVRQWISSKTVSDPSQCRESLMDQIRRGTRLRQTRTVNDRSAPSIN